MVQPGGTPISPKSSSKKEGEKWLTIQGILNDEFQRLYGGGWMDGWMNLDDGEGEGDGGRRERVKTRLNDAYRLFAPHFQIRRVSKSDRQLVIYKVQILVVLHNQEMN